MTSEALPPLSRILLPIDNSDPARKAVFFTGCLAIALGSSTVKQVTLLHVLAGRYLKEHMANIDIRAKRMIESEAFGRLREHYVENEVMPLLEKAADRLRQIGVSIPVNLVIKDGKPADKIIEVARAMSCSTIIMGRRGLSPVKEFILGSVTNSILHRPGHPSVYVVGQKMIEDTACPVPNILIPVDGSKCSMAAVREAAVFGHCLNHCLKKITLLRVIDLARYEKWVMENGRGKPEEEAREILHEAQEMLVTAGVPEKKIEKVAHYGWPVDTILETAEEEDVNLIIIGRYGRSALKDLVIGGVSSQVLHKAEAPTVAIVCG